MTARVQAQGQPLGIPANQQIMTMLLSVMRQLNDSCASNNPTRKGLGSPRDVVRLLMSPNVASNARVDDEGNSSTAVPIT